MMNRILSLLTLFFFSVVVSAADIKLNTRNLPANVVTEAQQKTAKVMDKLLLANDSILSPQSSCSVYHNSDEFPLIPDIGLL